MKCKNGKTYRLDMAYGIGIYKISVEVDGKDHLKPVQKQKDIIRDQTLRKENVFVIRVTGQEVFRDVEATTKRVLEEIREIINNKIVPIPIPIVSTMKKVN